MESTSDIADGISGNAWSKGRIDGRREERNKVHAWLLSKSGEAFADHDDKRARTLRDLADPMQTDLDDNRESEEWLRQQNAKRNLREFALLLRIDEEREILHKVLSEVVAFLGDDGWREKSEKAHLRIKDLLAEAMDAIVEIEDEQDSDPATEDTTVPEEGEG